VINRVSRPDQGALYFRRPPGGSHCPIGRWMFLARHHNGNYLPFGDSPKSGQ